MSGPAGPPPPAAPIVAVRAVSHRYGAALVVDGVSLEVAAGQVVGLFGPDGAGKSTLMGLIAGARRLQAGGIEVLGGSLARPWHRARIFPRIAYMPQGLGQNLYMTLSLRENLAFFARLFGLGRIEADRRIARLLRATRLAPFADRPAGKLSGGMKQKLGLCCALIHDPDLLILDEPTTGVDPLSRQEFWALVDTIRAERPQMGVLVSTAYMDEAARFDRLHAMWRGRIIGSGTAGEIRAATGRPTLEAAFIALIPEAERAAEVRLEIAPPRHDRAGAAIAARHLTRRFGDFTAVEDVSFDIPRGEIYGFLGSNGSGKTTTMKMLTGLLPPSEGEVSLFGQRVDAGDLATRARVGYMSQSFSLYGQMSVRENLVLHARLFRLGAAETAARVARLLEQFGLADHAATRAAALPLGQRQRLSLAVAMVHAPEILILDEPTSGVDPMARDAFWQILGDLSRGEGVTIFVSTHFMNEAALCDRIALMHAGRVLAEGPPAEIAARHGAGDLDRAFIALIEQVDPQPAAGAAPASPASAAPASAADAAIGASQDPGPGSGPRPGSDSSPRPRSGLALALGRALAFAGRETTEILRDPIRLVFAFLGTILLMLLFAYGISTDVEDMRYAVFDQDRSPESRAYLQTYESSPYFLQTDPVASQEALLRRLRAGDTTLILNIPPDFGRARRQGRDMQVSAWIDGANPQRAATIEGHVIGGHASYLAQAQRDTRAAGAARAGLQVETLFRYNPTNASIYAIAPAVPAMLLMMFPAILMAISVAREREIGTIVNFYVTPTSRAEFLLGKQVPYLGIGLLNFLLMTAMAVWVFGVPLKGSATMLSLGALVYVMAATGFGLLVSAFSRTQVTAVFATMVISMMPTVIFSGMIQPVETLEGGARLIGSLWPTRYYMEMSVGAFTKGLGAAQLAQNLPPIAAFVPAFTIPALLLLRKQER